MMEPPEEGSTRLNLLGEEVPGLEIKTVYTPDDVADIIPEKEIGKPGEYPFTRGTTPAMYRTGLWKMRVSTYYGLAADINSRIRFLRRHGDIAPSIAFDLPTRSGVDSDDPHAGNEAGRLGMAVDTLDDLEQAFSDIPLDEVNVSFPINGPADIILAMFIAVAQKRGSDPRKLHGVITNDCLQDYMSYGASIFPVQLSTRLAGDAIEYCAASVPGFRAVNISCVRPAGMSRAEALASMFLKASTYIEEVLRRGYAIDDFSHALSFQYASDDKLVESTAAIRAARRAWAEITSHRFGAKKADTMKLFIEAFVDPAILVDEEELRFNVTRVTCQALPGVLGGVQGLLVPTYDEVVGPPSELGIRVAARTHQVLAYELEDVTNVADPFGGSYFVERLTREVTGAVAKMVGDAITGRQPAGLIEEWCKYRPLALREMPGLGTETGTAQVKRLKEIKAGRDAGAVRKALDGVRQAVAREQNVMPSLIEAAKTYATLGEMVQALKQAT